jgi:hypothetical protein
MRTVSTIKMKATISRAQGCLLGQLAGDALGSLVEFRTPQDIKDQYPQGVRELADGGTWNTVAGQPTDDSEMALLLARMLADHGRYDPAKARKAYEFWLDSGPFDCGMTISSGLRGDPNPDSQANGAMMRIKPSGHLRRQLRPITGGPLGPPGRSHHPPSSGLPANQRPVHDGDCPCSPPRVRCAKPVLPDRDVGRRNEGGWESH